MRKNLHYKVLASVLAIAGLYFYNAPAAWADDFTHVENTPNTWIGNGEINGNNQIPDTASVYGWYSTYDTYGNSTNKANKNQITIKNRTLAQVYGAYTSIDKDTANSNKVTINYSKITNNVYGGYSKSGTASGNEVLIEGDNNSFYNVVGGSTSSGQAIGNTVTINGNVTLGDSYSSYIAGGEGSNNSTVSNNHVIIEDGTVIGNIYGGFGFSNSNALIDKNDITITGSANVAGANLYGGYNNTNTATISNNKFIIDGWQNNTVASLNNFSDIYINNFTLDTKNTNTNLLNVTNDNLISMDNITIHLGAFTGDIALAADDYAVGDIEAAKIEWDEDIKGSIVFTDENGNDVKNFADSLFAGSLANQTINKTFYIADRTDGGVYATKFDDKLGYKTGTNSVSITAEVEKSVLAGKFIDETRQEHTNGDGLTIGEGFETNVGTVAGVYAADGNNATGGKLIISGNTNYDKSLYGAYAENGNAENSTVEISGNTDYSGTVYAGYSEKGEVKDNTINVSKNIKANNMSLSGSNTTTAAGTLSITGNGSEFNEINNFETINFNKVALNEAAAINVQEANLTDTTTINVNSFADGQIYHGGESVTLLKSAKAITGAENVTIANNIVPTGLVQNLHISTAQSADNTSIDLYVEDVSMNGQINLVAENRAVAAAFVNQGTDLISDSLDTLSRDGSYGVKTFAAVHGNRSKYDVNSDLKINGWSTIVGVGNAAEFADGDEFSWGVFYENGSGNYRTYNEFNNEFFRGDGSLVYNGGGIAARYENASGVYTEGSLRAGMLKSEMDNALRDGAGNYYGYDSESAYYGAHIGVGKIISLNDSSDLDVYGKFFHTYTEGDSFTVAKDKFEFDSITSDRLRIGARVTTNKTNAFSTYYGLAYEYEFNGDADMRAQNLKVPTQSLQGSSYMAEVGFNYQPAPDSPWSFDLNMRGYAGEREGASFNVQATYTF